MADNPWMKFFPRDWRGDQALRAVSIAARGLWMECLCIMHEARPYGHLVLNGQPVGDDALARMTGASVDEVSALMAELRKAGVFNVTREGIIFSRRMTKDHARASKGRKAVQKRWAQKFDNKEKSSSPNRVPNRVPITQKPEARSQKEDANASIKDEREREFHETFWPAYPLKVGKPKALKAFLDARKKTSLDAIMAGVHRYASERIGRDKKYTKQAQGWLNREGWDDEAMTGEVVPSLPNDGSMMLVDGQLVPTTERRWIGRLETARRTGQWPASEWGPKPGDPGCTVPAHLLSRDDDDLWKEIAA